MSGTYKAIGINLKSSPLGESDRLLTVLTKEFGLLRVVAPGARKHKSSLGGRSSLFVVNQLLLARGKSLDKIIQAESVESYPGLSQDLAKLTAGQYLAELALYQALSDQPQTELFHLLREHLSRLEQFPAGATLPSLTHATFHLLVLAGVAPQVQSCCLSQESIQPDFTHPDWRIGFSITAGGTVTLAAMEQARTEAAAQPHPDRVADTAGSFGRRAVQVAASGRFFPKTPELFIQLDATELSLLQQLSQPHLIQDFLRANELLLQPAHWHHWLVLERVLRHYAQYHFDRPIRSASLIDVCFNAVDAPSVAISHDAIV